LTRYLAALALIALCILASHLLTIGPALPFARVQLDSRNVVWNDGWRGVPILQNFYNVGWLDDIVSMANMFFMPAVYGYDSSSRTQAISFLTDGGVVLVIWWLESLRPGSKPLYLQYPALLTLVGQIIGLGVVAPLYAFVSLTSPPTPFSLPTATTPLLPAIILGYYIPTFLALFSPDLSDRQAFLSIWQLFPLFVSLAYYTIASLSPKQNHSDGTLSSRPAPSPATSSASDTDSEPESPDPQATASTPTLARLNRESLLMRIYICVPVLLGALTWLFTLWMTRGNIAEIFIPTASPSKGLPSLTAFSAQFLRWDWTFVFGSMAVWVGALYVKEAPGRQYLPGVLKGKGRSSALGWLGLLGLGVISAVLLGPGATIGIAWWWREEIRAEELEKAVLKNEVQKKVDALLRANGA